MKPPFYLVSGSGKSFKLRLVGEGNTLTPIDGGSITVEEGELVEKKDEKKGEKKDEKKETSLPKYAIAIKGNLNAEERRTFTSFESSHEKNQADIHFEKHGDEFGDDMTKPKYIRLAKEFGSDTKGQYLDFAYGNTFVRCDLESCEERRVFVANARYVRTFYIWDPDFSRDPFAYAIVYTIENASPEERANRRLWHEELSKHGVNYLRGCEDLDLAAAVTRLQILFSQKSYIDDVDAAVKRWMPDIIKFFGGIPTPDQVSSWVKTAWIDD